jgi:RimJ/RimL family protein N-acetyltransferase
VAPPAYRLVTPRLVVRCWQPEHDAPLLHEALAASLDHLRPWMPWAASEPRTLDERVAFLRRSRGQFDLGEDFQMGILDGGETRVLGATGVHPRLRGGKALEIGYWLRPDLVGQGLCTEAVAALTRTVFEHGGLDRVEIHCAPDNVRSAAVPARLGYHHEATLRRRTASADGTLRDSMIWTLHAAGYPASPARRMAVQAFDCTGARLPLEPG